MSPRDWERLAGSRSVRKGLERQETGEGTEAWTGWVQGHRRDSGLYFVGREGCELISRFKAGLLQLHFPNAALLCTQRGASGERGKDTPCPRDGHIRSQQRSNRMLPGFYNIPVSW